MKKLFLTLFIIIFAFAIIFAGVYWHYKSQYHKPTLNPHPKYFLTVEGTVAPEFRGKGHLVFIATYSSTKDPCFHDTNPLAGLMESETRTKYYWITPDKNNHYQIKIPLDKYKPGVCGWVPYVVGMDFVEGKAKTRGVAFASISEQQSEKFNPSVITYVCNKLKINSCIINVKKGKDATIIIHPKQSYQISLNIKYQKNIKGLFNVYN